MLNYYLYLKARGLIQLIKLLNQSLTLVCLAGLITGLCLGEARNLTVFLLIILFSLVVLQAKMVLLFFTCLSVGFVYSTNYFSTINNELSSPKVESRLYEFKVIENGKLGKYSQTFVTEAKNLNSKVILETSKYPQRFAGETFESEAIFVPIDEYYNNDTYVNYLKSRGIFFYTRILEAQSNDNKNYMIVLSKLNNRITENMNFNVTYPESALANGLVTGNTNYFEEDFKSNLRATGTSHIAAVSGFNMILIYSTLISFSGIIPRKQLILLSLFFVTCYFIIVGVTNIPAQRATMSVFIIAFASLTGRKNSSLIAILLTALVMLLEYPGFYKNVSFQLSISATTGILLFSKNIQGYFKNFIPSTLNEILGTTIAATLFTSPIILHHFKEMSSISILVNLIVLPYVSVTTISGILASIFELLKLTLLAELFYFVTESLSDFIIYTIEISALNLGKLNETIQPIYFLPTIIIILFTFDLFKCNASYKLCKHHNTSNTKR